MKKEISKKNKILITFSIVCIITIALLSILWAYTNDSKDLLTTVSRKNALELKTTDTSTVSSNGVYITDVSEVVDNVMPSIVAITSKTIIKSGNFGYSFFGNGDYTATGAGSGVIVAQDDDSIYIVTNYHVVENSSELSVKFIDDESYDATIKGTSKNNDIAIVTVKKTSLHTSTLEKIKVATIGNSDELKVGNGIIAIGNALGYGQSVTTGVVSALNREVSTEESTQDMIQIDAAINGGNSGGALINSKGEVVGINTAKYSSSGTSSSASVEGMGFAIPISEVKDIITSLMNGENVDQNSLSLGIEGYMTSESKMVNLPNGFYVSSIVNGSNADKSELEIGNIITEVDGNKVSSIETIKKVLKKKIKGDKITLKVKYVSKNEYKEKEISVTLN